MIPRVDVKVTPLVPHGSAVPLEYAVRISLPAPSDSDSEWLEFGLAQPSEPLVPKDLPKKHQLNGNAAEGGRLPPQFTDVPFRLFTKVMLSLNACTRMTPTQPHD